jgi:hypothetical protein
MAYVSIDETAHSYVTTAADPEDSWSADSTHTDHFINGFTMSGNSGLPVGFTPVADKDYFLVYALYTTGDSFSSHSGELEYIGLYQSAEFAYNIKQKLESHDDAGETRYNIDLTTEDGREYTLCIPWIGYFESLDSITVEVVRLL